MIYFLLLLIAIIDGKGLGNDPLSINVDANALAMMMKTRLSQTFKNMPLDNLEDEVNGEDTRF